MVEAVVSMVILAIVATVVATILVGALGVSRGASQRVTAANLAAKQIEAARSMRTLDIPDGATNPYGGPVLVGGTSYTVVQTASYVASDSSSGSACTGSGNSLAYKLVTVVVTWPNMRTVQPVRSDTLKALGFGADGLDQNSGAAAVSVTDSLGQPQQNVTVSLSPGNRSITTGVDGCAIFVGLAAPGSYTATLNATGYVGIDGSPTVSKTLGVTAATVARVSLSYDLHGALAVTFQPPTGFVAPNSLPVTLSDAVWSGGPQAFPDCSTVGTAPVGCVSGTPRLAASLFPGNSTYPYTAWAGSCADAKPANGGSSAIVGPGATAGVTVALAPVTVQVRSKQTGLPVTGKTINAVHASGTGCLGGYSVVLPSNGVSDFNGALPNGTWTFQVTVSGTLYTSTAVVLSSSISPVPVALVQVP